MGSAAIQIAKAVGATVFVTASSQDKLDYCKVLLVHWIGWLHELCDCMHMGSIWLAHPEVACAPMSTLLCTCVMVTLALLLEALWWQSTNSPGKLLLTAT